VTHGADDARAPASPAPAIPGGGAKGPVAAPFDGGQGHQVWRRLTVVMTGASPLSVRGDAVPRSALAKRLGSAIVLIPVVIWLTLAAPAALFHAVVIAMATAATWELGRMFERAGRATHRWLGPALAAGVTASFLLPGGPVVALAVAVVVVLSAPLWRNEAPSTERATTTLLAVTYIGWLLGHGILLRELPGGGGIVLVLLGVTWVGESAAYFVGSTIGRRKLAPVVSPNKTVEGAVAQVITSVIGAMLLAAWLAPGWSATQAAAAGVVVGVIGQVGDLSESVIKRSVGTKDTGGLIPGHGGVLDRLDSLLFNVPALYYLVVITGGRA
jgi:phosphatidate cytidylyltransferase